MSDQVPQALKDLVRAIQAAPQDAMTVTHLATTIYEFGKESWDDGVRSVKKDSTWKKFDQVIDDNAGAALDAVR